jgi:glycosyltransferase involved in cell wall biosynthesis
MKLLLYVHDWAPTIGGIQSVTLSLARNLATYRSPTSDPFEITLVTATLADHMDDSAFPFRVIRRPSLGQLFRLTREANVVHLAGPCVAPLVFALLLRKPVCIEHHGFQPVCPNGQLVYQPNCSQCPGHFMAGRHLECLRCNSDKGLPRSLRLWLLTFLRRALSKRATTNILPAEILGRTLQLPHQLVIPHGIPVPATTTAAAPAAHKAIPPVIAFHGRLVSAKGPQLLLQAAHELSRMTDSFRISFIGDGPDRVALESRASALGLSSRVSFLGRVPEDQLGAILSSATVLVIPSIGGEVFGLVAAENMIRSLPAIVPEGGALAEVAGDSALTFFPGDASSLAAAISRTLREPGLAQRLGAAARSRALARFTEAEMVARHAGLYTQLRSKS